MLVLVATAGAAGCFKPPRPAGLSDAEWSNRLLICDRIGMGRECAVDPVVVRTAQEEYLKREAQRDAQRAARQFADGNSASGTNSASVALSPAQERDHQRTWVFETQQAVRAKMRDPESVRFRNVVFHRGVGGVPMVCGEVNGRNGFGAYSGFQPFIASGADFGPITPTDMARGEFDKAWRQNCTN